MSTDGPLEMDASTRDAFLGTGGTGVLSLQAETDEPPHTVPVSYGYDASESTFYFRLAGGSEGAKHDLDGRAASFVTYGDDDGWHSVVARGRLEDVDDEAIATETLAGLERVDIPLVDIFHVPLREVQFEFYRLAPAELTGRVESSVRSD